MASVNGYLSCGARGMDRPDAELEIRPLVAAAVGLAVELEREDRLGIQRDRVAAVVEGEDHRELLDGGEGVVRTGVGGVEHARLHLADLEGRRRVEIQFVPRAAIAALVVAAARTGVKAVPESRVDREPRGRRNADVHEGLHDEALVFLENAAEHVRGREIGAESQRDRFGCRWIGRRLACSGRGRGGGPAPSRLSCCRCRVLRQDGCCGHHQEACCQ